MGYIINTTNSGYIRLSVIKTIQIGDNVTGTLVIARVCVQVIWIMFSSYM